MKSKIALLLIVLLPALTFAGQGDKDKKNIKVNITVDKKGSVEVSGLNGDLKKLQDDLNKLLENVTIKIDDGKKKHEVQIKAQIK